MSSSSSPPLFNHQVSSSLSDKNHGRSKAQMCLKKIVDLITYSKSFEVSNRSLVNVEFESQKQEEETDDEKILNCCGKRGFDIDLNLRLGPWFESENENKGFSACSGVGEDVGGITTDASTVNKSSEGECDPKQGFNSREQQEEERVVLEDDEETRESSEITNLQVLSSEIETGKQKTQLEEEEEVGVVIEVEEQSKLLKRRSEGYLDLLVEAAKLISGNFKDDDDGDSEGSPDGKKPSRTGQSVTESVRLELKGNESWMLDCYGGFEDISPIVRSKRGRNQVLPFKYRDSILEPWKRLTKQRSSRISSKPKTK